MGAMTCGDKAGRGGRGEGSGRYHRKATVREGGGGRARPAFLFDTSRLILPAYGTYTGKISREVSNKKAGRDMLRPRARTVALG